MKAGHTRVPMHFHKISVSSQHYKTKVRQGAPKNLGSSMRPNTGTPPITLIFGPGEINGVTGKTVLKED